MRDGLLLTGKGGAVLGCEFVRVVDEGTGTVNHLNGGKTQRSTNTHEDVDRNIFFKLKEGSRTRGHKAALVKERCMLDMRKYSFSQRVINEWNKVSNDCVNASSVNMFKNRIDRYLIRVGYT